MRRAVFLDRDGTLIRHVDLLSRPDQVDLAEAAATGVRLLRDAGFLAVIVTNQPAVAYGVCTEADVAAVHAHIQSILATHGTAIDAFYHCPHHPDGQVPKYATACACRKPAPGMLLRAADDLGIELATSVMVGDRDKDIEAGRQAGCHTVLVGTAAQSAVHSPAELRCTDLLQAAHDILARWHG